MSLSLPGMAAFLSACLTLAVGLLALGAALPMAQWRRGRSGRGFWSSYVEIATPALAFAALGLAWAVYLNDSADDGLAPWPPITALLAAVCVAFASRRRR